MASNNDILGNLAQQSMTQEDLLRSIDQSLHDIIDNGLDISQASLGDLQGNYSSARRNRSRNGNRNNGSQTQQGSDRWQPNRGRQQRRRNGSLVDDITDNFEKQLAESLFGTSAVKDALTKSISNFADQLGVSVDEIGSEVGKLLANRASEAIKNSAFGQRLTKELNSYKDWGVRQIQQSLNRSANWLRGGQNSNSGSGGTNGPNPNDSQSNASQNGQNSNNGPQNIIDFAQRAQELGNAGTNAAQSEQAAADAAARLAGQAQNAAGAAGAAGNGLAGAAGAAGEVALAFPLATAAVVAAVVAIELFSNALGPAIEGIKAYAKAAKAAANSTRETQKQQLKRQEERIAADMNVFLQSSFDVLKEATQSMLQSWDNALGKVTATQGYTKADVQDLLSAYAGRLQSEGLSSVISTADLLDNLQRVLDSGLSGVAAEEFAYIATILNKAVPTQDFFGYAETYASIAANQIAAGRSQAEALTYANAELEQFASNLLYSSRELAGGFSTGLKDGSKLLEDAVKIANTSKVGDAATISGVLTSVSAIVGAIAPDLASTLVDNVVNAAVGGNNDTGIVALRSISGVGASNTAFLRALAEDPQSLFANLFSNLAELQQMSNDNFMEVAEGLSDVFGVQKEAFARVDFNYLASAISAMNVNNSSLEQNMKLLVSGQTTSTAEQLRMQEINQTMLEEGLAYVLDNEVARVMQQHMWDQELANQITEAEYAVNLQGSSLELLQGLQHTVQSIITILNPALWFKKFKNIEVTSKQMAALSADIGKLLDANKVGQGSADLKAQLLNTSGTALSSRGNYLELLTGHSSYRDATVARRAMEYETGQVGWGVGGLGGTAGAIRDTVKFISSLMSSKSSSRNVGASTASAQYTWGTIGKTLATAVNNSIFKTGSAYAEFVNQSSQSRINAITTDRLQQFINTMDEYVQRGDSYNDWAKSAVNYGITNLSETLKDFNMTERDVKDRFEDIATQSGAELAAQKDALEQRQLNDSVNWYEEVWTEFQPTIYKYADDIIEHEEILIDRADTQIKQLIQANAQLKEFYTQWIDYFVNHTAYTKETLSAYDVAAIRNAEKSETGDAVLALAQALTSNAVDLKDPAVQTNVLLSQILIVAEAIMQQQNNTTEVSLPTALSALGLGVTSTPVV